MSIIIIIIARNAWINGARAKSITRFEIVDKALHK